MKLIPIFLIPLLFLFSCTKEIEKDENTIVQNLPRISSGIMLSWEDNRFYQEKGMFLSNLLEIEKKWIVIPLIDEKEFYNFVNDNSGATFIGKEKDWIKALETPCTKKEVQIPVYNQYASQYEPMPNSTKLDQNRYCFSGSLSENQQSVSDLMAHLRWSSRYTSFRENQLNTKNLKSNLDSYPSHPTSPLERLIASQIFYGMAVERFVLAVPYRDEIIVLYAASQEPWIPWYRPVRIYLEAWKIYIQDIYFNDTWKLNKKLDVKYGNTFTSNLEQDAYDIESAWYTTNIETDINKSYKGKFDPEEIRLLSWDWLRNPSIINKKIEERIIKDLIWLTSK